MFLFIILESIDKIVEIIEELKVKIFFNFLEVDILVMVEMIVEVEELDKVLFDFCGMLWIVVMKEIGRY